MMKAERSPSKAWQRKCVARWRLLSAQGLDLQVAAAEIGVSANDLAVWSRGSSSVPLLIPGVEAGLGQVACVEAGLAQVAQVTGVEAGVMRSAASAVARPGSDRRRHVLYQQRRALGHPPAHARGTAAAADSFLAWMRYATSRFEEDRIAGDAAHATAHRGRCWM